LFGLLECTAVMYVMFKNVSSWEITFLILRSIGLGK